MRNTFPNDGEAYCHVQCSQSEKEMGACTCHNIQVTKKQDGLAQSTLNVFNYQANETQTESDVHRPAKRKR